MILWKFTVREMRHRPGRATLTLLSIVIGVAAVVAVTLCGKTTRRAYREMYESLAGRTGLEVVADGAGVQADELVRSLERLPGVRVAVPMVQQTTTAYHQGQRTRMLVMGIDPSKEAAIRDYEIRQGSLFEDGRGAVLEAGFAEALGIRLHDEIKVLTRRGLKADDGGRAAGTARRGGLQAGRRADGPVGGRPALVSASGLRQHDQPGVDGGRAGRTSRSRGSEAAAAGRAGPHPGRAHAVGCGDDGQPGAGSQIRVRHHVGPGDAHDPEHVLDERQRTPPPVGRLAGRRRDAGPDPRDAAPRRAWCWASWARCWAAWPGWWGRRS